MSSNVFLEIDCEQSHLALPAIAMYSPSKTRGFRTHIRWGILGFIDTVTVWWFSTQIK
jgi:hypothetical protein